MNDDNVISLKRARRRRQIEDALLFALGFAIAFAVAAETVSGWLK